MRIALIAGTFPVLSETFVRDEVINLLRDGHEVHVYCASIGDDPRAFGQLSVDIVNRIARAWAAEELPPVARVRRALASLPAFLRYAPRSLALALNARRYGHDATSLRMLVRAAVFLPPLRFDAIHAHFGDIGMLAQQLRDVGVLRGPLVTTFHGYDVSSLLRERGADYYRPLFASGDLFLPVNEAWRRRLESIGCPADRIRVHRLGVDLSVFAERSTVDRAGPVRILSLARLVEKKGIEFGIAAVAMLVDQGFDVRYDIVGDGPMMNQLKQLAARIAPVSAIRFLGARPHADVAQLLADADILLYPSVTGSNGDQEGIPVTIMEAMAMGLPVVGSRHAGIPELVEHGVTGFLASEGAPAELADALRRLILDAPLRRTMGESGRHVVAERHEAGRQFRELREILSSVGTPVAS